MQTSVIAVVFVNCHLLYVCNKVFNETSEIIGRIITYSMLSCKLTICFGHRRPSSRMQIYDYDDFHKFLYCIVLYRCAFCLKSAGLLIFTFNCFTYFTHLLIHIFIYFLVYLLDYLQIDLLVKLFIHLFLFLFLYLRIDLLTCLFIFYVLYIYFIKLRIFWPILLYVTCNLDCQ